jgi:predicted nucleic acid-binding protein
VRAVIDTNVLIAALLWRGPPHALIAQLAEVICGATFDAILAQRITSRERAARLR